MKAYVIIDQEALLKNDGTIDEDSWTKEISSIYSTLEAAIDCLETNGYKLDIGYSREDKRPGYSQQVSDCYWYDYNDGIVSCSWVEERSVEEKVDFFFDDDDMFGKCCGNCEYFTYFDIDDLPYCYCDEDDCPGSNNEYKDSCEYFEANDFPQIEYDLYISHKNKE